MASVTAILLDNQEINIQSREVTDETAPRRRGANLARTSAGLAAAEEVKVGFKLRCPGLRSAWAGEGKGEEDLGP